MPISFKECKMRICSVLVTSPVEKAYDYLIPEDMELGAGDYVTVPLGPRAVHGVVWAVGGAGEVSTAKMKAVIQKHDLPPMDDIQMKFIDWVASYNMERRGSVLKMALSVPQALEPSQPMTGYILGTEALSPSGRGLGEGEAYRAKPSATLIQHSQELRHNQTHLEQKLWLLLKGRQFEGCKFRRQHPIYPYIVDFVCLEKNLVIELDGGQHTDNKNYDSQRDEFLKSKGFTILRFWNNEVIENLEGVLYRVSESLGLSPSPNPLPGGARAQVMHLLEDGLPRRLSEITHATGASASTVKTLAKHGVLQAIDIFAKAPCANPDPNFAPKNLTREQDIAADKITKRIDQGGFEAFLLDGVTGSGKTEVYFEAIAKIIAERQGQILILMPEIALSNSFIRRFAERFGVKPALWHSSLTPAQRRLTWRSIVTGQTKVVVGARSALFLPYADLKLIVVDEEHDPAFKQEEVTIYNARDMAVVRAHQGKIPIILASATPSLETMHNVWDGRYTLLHLPDRFGGASKPDIQIIDLRVDKPERQHFMSPKLRDEVQATLDNKQQALLFLNRRGFAPLTLCRTCGHRMECPKCTSWLVEHKRGNQLQCHHCGFSIKTPDTCIHCHDTHSLVACGPGVERIAEEVKEYFPEARTLILASDITDTHDKLIEALDAIKNGDVDIIIGTQIIAKGHHFPQITCVGIIDADLGLSGGDLRATERSYQLLHQVAGRAGREQLKGHVYLQTYNAEQRVMQMIAADDRDGFLEAEADERQAAKMPPFSRLAALIITGKNETQTKDVAVAIGRAAPRAEGVQILGPAPAQMYRIRGNFRQRILIRAEKTLNIQKMIAEWLGTLKIPSSVRVVIDIDPQSFL